MKKGFLLLVLLFGLSYLGWGQILTFEFSALAGDEVSATSNSNNANLTSSTITRGSGLTASANAQRFNATSWALTSIANAVSGNDYMEFTITPNSGYQFTVSSIVVQWQRSATGNSAIALRSSVDSYVSDLDAVKTVTDNTSTQTFTYTFTQSNSTTAVTYRFYSYAEATTGSGGPGDGAGNDIVVNGTVTSSGNVSPTVTTQAVSSPGTTSATGNGNITNTGGENPSARGFCWDLYANPDPDLSDSHSTESGSFGTGTYTGTISGVSAETRFKVVAYATNTPGTGYGSAVNFWTLSPEPLTHSTTFGSTVISQTQINLSFDAASTITNADGYIILKKTGSAPSGLPADGNAYTVGNTLGDATVAAVVASTSTTTANITGLAAGTHYYFTIMPYNYNGSNNETYNYKTDGAIPGTNATTDPPLDATSEVSGPATGSQPNPVLISSLATTEGSAVLVFKMDIWDYATSDAQPTKVTQLTIKPGSNNTANWANTIQGIKLSTDAGATFITIGTPAITASSIVIPVTSGNLNIPNGSALTVSLYIYLKNSGLTDNQILEFKVDAAAASHGFIADPTGSTFLSAFPTAPVSNQMLIDVIATKYKFSTQPSNTTVNTNFSAGVEAVDANNNRDLDQTSSVTLAASAGALSSVTGNPHVLSSGVFLWTDLQINAANISVTLSATGTLTPATSGLFIVFAAQPTTQASSIVFSNVAVNAMTVSWTSGNGAYRIVVVKQGGAPGVPTNGATYTGNAQYGIGGTIAPLEYVLYNGTSNTVDVTGLTGSTSYTFKVFEYNGGSGIENYNTTSNAATQVTSGLTYYSNTSGDPLTLANWNSNRDGTSGSTPTAFNLGDIFVIQSGNNMTTTVSWGVSGTNSKLQIESGGTLTANHTVTFPSGTTFQIDNGGNYIQNTAMSMGSSVFAGTEVFASGSNITITIMPGGTSAPTAPGWGNLTINQTTGSTALGWAGNLSAIQGSLTILGTGSGTTRHAFTSNTDVTTTIGGNFTLTGGNFYLSSGTGKNTVNLSGNLVVNGGNLDLAYSSGVGTINVAGNVTVSSGSLTEGGSTTTSKIVFNKSGTQTFTGGGAISAIVNFEVASGSTTNLGTNIISGAGAFTLIAGGTLGIGSADGITSGVTASGNIQVTGTRTYNAGGNYTYNGSGVQAPGNGLPATVNNLTVAGTSDLTLAANQTVSGDLTVSSGAKLTLPSANTLSVTGNTDLTGSECLVLKSDAGNTASFICDGSISGTGTAKVERYIAQYTTADDGWHLLSSPVASFTVTGSSFEPVSGDDDLYWFNETQYLWMNWLVTSFDFGTDQGYLCAYKTDGTKYFTGTLNNEIHTIAGNSYNPAIGGGWHIIPNPFPSAIAWNSGGMYDDGYASTASGKVLNGGRSYTEVYDGGFIPAMNGFVMQVNNATNSITIPKSARVHNSTPWYKNSGDRLLMLTAQSSENTTYQETVIRFDENATEGFDKRYDSPFLSAASTVPVMYTTLADNTDLSLNTFPALTTSRVVPVNFIKGSSAGYSIHATKLEELGNDVSLSLEDIKLSVTLDLRQTPSYAFTSAEGDDPHRFLLHIGAPNGVNDVEKDQAISIYSYNNTLYISNNTGAFVKGDVFVYNLMGQQLMQEKLSEGSLTKISLNAGTAYYLIKVVTCQKAYSAKVFIQ